MALTDTRLRSLKSTGARYEVSDRDGLTLRVSQRGVMAWTVTFRVQGTGEDGGIRRDRLTGPKQRFTLGEYPTLSLAEAREKASVVKRLARAGADPVTTLRPKPKAVFRVADLIERYAAEHLHRNMRAGANVEKLLQLHVSPDWGERELADITRSDFVGLLEKIRRPRLVKIEAASGTYEAMRGGTGSAAEVRKWTRAMFQFAVDVQLLTENPLANVRNRDRQKARSHVLSMDDLRTVWRAAEQMGYPWGPYFQLIILTGDRGVGKRPGQLACGKPHALGNSGTGLQNW